LLALGDPAYAPAEPAGPPPPPPDHGVLLTQVVRGGNADHSGLQANDVLLCYGGTKLTGAADLTTALAKPGGPGLIAVEVWRAGRMLTVQVGPGSLGVSLSKQTPADAVRGERAFQALMRQTRGPAMTALPGSRREVEAIARLFDQPVLLLGSEASEQRLDRLRLRDYAYLHLATHGVLDPRQAMHSALILAQDALPDPLAQVLAGQKAYDGRLTAGQVLRTWRLDARLVTLSACQSGLGPYRGGEGYVGFAQALLLAGSRGVLLSQWQVDDDATALLMTRFYQNLLGKRAGLDGPLGKAAALAEAKVWLRGLREDEVKQRLADFPRGTPRVRLPGRPSGAVHPYGHPYYWAAFILVGDPR
jgi:CHAT domain-containing protein